MRASKCQQGNKTNIPKMDTPAPMDMMSRPSQQDNQETIKSSIKNNKKYQKDKHEDSQCSSNTPNQSQSNGKEPDKGDCQVLVEEVQDKDEIPGPNHNDMVVTMTIRPTETIVKHQHQQWSL